MSRSRNTGFVVDNGPTWPQRIAMADRKPRRICWCRLCNLYRNDPNPKRVTLERIALKELRAA